MRVETDLKLGFKDVLIRPKRSNLASRALVTLERTFTFLHSRRQWTGVPIIAANMDTVGTFEVAEVLAGHGMLTAIHKHYPLAAWEEFLARQDDSIFSRIMVSTGTAEADFDKLGEVLSRHPGFEFICVDVANGYAEAFVGFVAKVREAFPDKTIVAGNVVTG
jgi:GMP reductase